MRSIPLFLLLLCHTTARDLCTSHFIDRCDVWTVYHSSKGGPDWIPARCAESFTSNRSVGAPYHRCLWRDAECVPDTRSCDPETPHAPLEGPDATAHKKTDEPLTVVLQRLGARIDVLEVAVESHSATLKCADDPDSAPRLQPDQYFGRPMVTEGA